MKSIQIFSLFIFFLFALSCGKNEPKETITKATDYAPYLKNQTNTQVDFAKKELDFWQKKYKESPNQLTYLSKMAGAHAQLFETTGDVHHLVEAGNLLKKGTTMSNEKNANTLRALAKNYISQHRFKEALVAVEKAFALGEGKLQSQYMLFDVHLELGNRNTARDMLFSFENRTDFNYLIRASKWADHEGDLPLAITYMEEAKKQAETTKNTYLMQWAYTNIADYYGHAGRLDDSYNHYLKALKLDANDVYALRGIAWIVFSHEKNTAEAKRILSVIALRHPTPDIYLLNAEIAEYEGDSSALQANMNRYWSSLQNPGYGDMYNAYNITLLAEQQNKAQTALQIAQKEVENRPTPQAYDLLAYSYLKNGDTAQAIEISTTHVLGKTTEPMAQYHLAEIFKANGQMDKVVALKNELLGAAYELGPNMVSRIAAL